MNVFISEDQVQQLSLFSGQLTRDDFILYWGYQIPLAHPILTIGWIYTRSVGLFRSSFRKHTGFRGRNDDVERKNIRLKPSINVGSFPDAE